MRATDNNRPAGTPTPRVVTGGCATLILGVLLIAAGLIGQAIGGRQVWVAVVAGVGLILFFGSVFLMVGAGAWMIRQARKQWARIAVGVPVPVDLAAIRAIEGARLGATSDAFGSGLVGARRIDVGPYATYLAANLPRARLLERRRTFEPAAAYQWIDLGVTLPRLVLTTDFRGQQALVGRDVHIENEDFNRRFRIDCAIPLTRRAANPAYDDFARYATAVLHPRAAQCVTGLPTGYMLIIEGGLLATVGPPTLDEAMVLRTAQMLTELAGLIPRHVRARWATSTDYRPRA